MRALEPPEKIPPIVPVQQPVGPHVDEEDQHGQSLDPQEEPGSLAFIDSDAESIVMLNGSSHNEEDKIVTKKSHNADVSSTPLPPMQGVFVPDSIKTVKTYPENKSTDHYSRRRRKRREGRVLGVGGGMNNSVFKLPPPPRKATLFPCSNSNSSLLY